MIQQSRNDEDTGMKSGREYKEESSAGVHQGSRADSHARDRRGDTTPEVLASQRKPTGGDVQIQNPNQPKSDDSPPQDDDQNQRHSPEQTQDMRDDQSQTERPGQRHSPEETSAEHGVRMP
jgi:hypothetical protein